MHAKHVDYLDRILVDLCAGVYADEGYFGVIIEEPPRHGKSELCSHYFPAWFLGAFPDRRVILASYEADFASSWGRKTRNTIEDYGHWFGIEVDRRSSAADRWDLKGRKGGMITAGIRGSITGRGGHLLIVDDPIKNMEEAQSETIREKIWMGWKSTIRTRAEPGAIGLVIQTRWHEDDLVGRLLEDDDEDADKWIRVRMPAIAEEPDEDFPDPDVLGRSPGEVLFPERITLQMLRPHMANEQVWAALYQQRPAPKEGSLFKVDDFPIVPHPGGKFKKMVRFWDLAASDEKDGEDPDWTVGALLGLHYDGDIYILDIERFRMSQIEPRLNATKVRDGRVVRVRAEQEPGAHGKLYIKSLARSIYRGWAFRGVRATGDKRLRAEVMAMAAERGEIKVVKGKWNKEFFKELRKFPYGTHDDQVDSCSGAYAELVKRGGAAWSG